MFILYTFSGELFRETRKTCELYALKHNLYTGFYLYQPYCYGRRQ